MWIKNFMPGNVSRFIAFDAPDGAGGEGTGDGGTGEGVTDGDVKDGGTGEGDGKPAGTPDAILKGGTGDADANAGGDDTKPKDGDGDGDGDGTTDEQDTVPEGDYDFTGAMPDGVTLDAALAGAMAPAMKEAGITQKQANILAATMATVTQANAEASAQGFVDQVTEWTDAARADKEIGGTDENWKATVDIANAAIQKVGTPEFTAMLGETGVSNHPEMIRVMARVGKALGQDTLDPDLNVDTSDVPTEAKWYGKTTSDKKKG